MEKEKWVVVNLNDQIFEGYYISSKGRLYSTHVNKFIKGVEDEKGYLRVTFTKRDKNGKKIRKTTTLHRVVMLSFKIPQPEGCGQIDHLNGNKHMNMLENLEWVDCKTNIQRSWKTGLHDNDIRCGENAGNSKYKTADIEMACKLKADGHKTAEISRMLNISIHTLSKIFTGKQWTNISSRYNLLDK